MIIQTAFLDELNEVTGLYWEQYLSVSFEAHVEGWSFYCYKECVNYQGTLYYINAAPSTCRKMTQVRQDTFEAAWAEVISNIFEAPEGP